MSENNVIDDATMERILASLGPQEDTRATDRLRAAQKRMDESFRGDMKFEKPRQPFVIGKLNSRVWQAPYTMGLTDRWRQRCHEYWERVEYRFGVIFSAPRNAWADDPFVGPVVATYATPLLIVPGERFIVPEGERIIH